MLEKKFLSDNHGTQEYSVDINNILQGEYIHHIYHKEDQLILYQKGHYKNNIEIGLWYIHIFRPIPLYRYYL